MSKEPIKIELLTYFNNDEFIEYVKNNMPKNKWLDFTAKLYTDGKDVYLESPCLFPSCK